MQANSEQLKVYIDQLHEEREKHALLRSQLDGLGEQLNSEKLYIADLESLMQRLLQLKSVDP